MRIVEVSDSQIRKSEQAKARKIVLDKYELISRFDHESKKFYSRYPFALNQYKTGNNFSSQAESDDYRHNSALINELRKDIVGNTGISYPMVKKWYDIYNSNPYYFLLLDELSQGDVVYKSTNTDPDDYLYKVVKISPTKVTLRNKDKVEKDFTIRSTYESLKRALNDGRAYIVSKHNNTLSNNEEDDTEDVSEEDGESNEN